MAKKLRIIVDMDAIIADFFGTLCARYNAAHPDEDIDPEDFKSWIMTDWVKDGPGLLKIFHQPGFFRDLAPIDGACGALKALQDDGHEIVIVSTPCTAWSATEKLEWLQKHFDFLPHKKGFFGEPIFKNVFIGSEKYMIQADAIIDDGPHNVAALKKVNPKAFAVTIGYGYNRGSDVYDGVFGGYQMPYSAWASIVKAIREQSEV